MGLEPDFKQTKVIPKLARGSVDGRAFRERATWRKREEVGEGSNDRGMLVLIRLQGELQPISASLDRGRSGIISSGWWGWATDTVRGSGVLGKGKVLSVILAPQGGKETLERNLGNKDWVDIAESIRGTTKNGSGRTARDRNIFGAGEETHLGVPRESKLGADAGIIEDLVTPVLVEFVGDSLDNQASLRVSTTKRALAGSGSRALEKWRVSDARPRAT